MSERSENEFDLIASAGWFEAAREYIAQVFGTLRSLNVQTDELRTKVWEVPITCRPLAGGTEVDFEAGHADDGSPLYVWRIPTTWVLPAA
jgi:hypothetical protein